MMTLEIPTLFSIFLLILTLSIIVSLNKRFRILSYYLNLSFPILLLISALKNTAFQSFLDDNMIFEINFLYLTIFLSILTTILNGQKTFYNLINSTFTNIAVLIGCASNFQNFIIFFIAIAILSLISLLNYSKDEISKSHIFNYLHNFMALIILSIGIFFFYLATNSFEIINYSIVNLPLFLISISLVFISFLYLWGIFPFYGENIHKIINLTRGNLIAQVLITNLIIGTTFYTFILNALTHLPSPIKTNLTQGVVIIVGINIIISGILAFFEQNDKKALAYANSIHLGFLLLSISLLDNIITLNIFTQYYWFISISYVGILLIINQINNNSSSFYKGSLTILCLSLAGLPTLAGFTLRYKLLYELIKNSNLLSVLFIFLGTIILLSFYLKIISSKLFNTSYFSHINLNQYDNIKLRLVLIILIIITILGGIPDIVNYHL